MKAVNNSILFLAIMTVSHSCKREVVKPVEFPGVSEVSTEEGEEPQYDDTVVETNDEYRRGGYLWRPSRISASVERTGILLLEQKLPEGEYGWTLSRMDIPSVWDINNLGFDGLYLCFSNQHGEDFRVKPPKLKNLDYELLNGGSKSDEVVADLWRKYAKVSSESSSANKQQQTNL